MKLDRANTGKIGENFAVKFLEKRGYSIIRRNYRTRLGEIDIIAQEGETVAIVEVRTKSRTDYGLPRDTVDRNKQNRIIKATKQYLAETQIDYFIRFDMIEVIIDNDKVHVEHLKNVFFA